MQVDNPTPSVFGVSQSNFKGQAKQAKQLEQIFDFRNGSVADLRI